MISIDNTATVSTIWPQGSPIARGIAPMAACTVAFGVYAIMQNSFSFLFSGVLIRDKRTPAILKSSAPSTNTIELIPADMAYFKSTVAPTRACLEIHSRNFSFLTICVPHFALYFPPI